MRQFFLFFLLILSFFSVKSALAENFHLFFLDKLEGNLALQLKKDAQSGYQPRSELFLYEVAYSGLPVGQCLIKYYFTGQKFRAEFLANTKIMPEKILVEIDPKNILPEKIEIFEKHKIVRTIIYDQKNTSIAINMKTQPLVYQIIEPITLACLFRTFDLAAGQIDFFVGQNQDLFVFKMGQRKLIKTPDNSQYQYLSEPPKISIYLSSDRQKLPLVVIYDLFVGRLELKLKKYSLLSE